MSDSFALVILAAGQGTRLKTTGPKPLISIAGKKLIDFPLRVSTNFLKQYHHQGGVTVVTGHQENLVREHIRAEFSNDTIYFVHQKNPLGTADAVKTYLSGAKDAKKYKYTIVMCADTPLLNEQVLQDMLSFLKSNNGKAVAATFSTENPFGYGRIVRGDKGFKIVEERDADEKTKGINEVNTGLYVMETEYLLEHIGDISSDNKASEFYLTDIFDISRDVYALEFSDSSLFFGVNSLDQLEQAELLLRRRKVRTLVEDGVRFIDSRHVYIDEDVVIDSGSTVYPNTYIKGKTQISEGCVIEQGCAISDSTIGKNTNIKAYSYITGASVGDSCNIGPFARLREKSQISNNCKIGNFVETKNVALGNGVSMSHLSYAGDAEIGEMTNIGCGFITCNYDGESKHKTTIGKNSFVGSDSQTIAPIKIGDSCYIASGSTINQDVPSGSFSIARSRQVIKERVAKRFLKGKWLKDVEL